MRAGDAGNGGARSSHALDLLGKNLDDDTHLAGPAVRIAVLAQVLLGERVDVLIGALLRHLDDAPPDLEVAVGVVRVLHRKRDLRIPLKVLVLHPPPGSVEADVLPVVVHPDRGHLRRPVPADGRDVGERLFREQVTAVLGNRRHSHAPLPLSSSSTEKAWRTDLTASVPPIKTPTSSVSAISASVAPWSRTSSTR